MKKSYAEPEFTFFLINKEDIIRNSDFVNYSDLSEGIDSDIFT